MIRLNRVLAGCMSLLIFAAIVPSSSPAQTVLLTTGTIYEGATTGKGLISFNTDGDNSLLHNFVINDLTHPSFLQAGADGKLYGIANSGGNYQKGAIFSTNADGSDFSVIYHLPTGERFPMQYLALGPDSKIYFVQSGKLCSINNDGSAFTVIPGLPPPPGSIYTFRIDDEGWLYQLRTDSLSRNVLFRIKTNGTGLQDLHTFTRSADGYPNSLSITFTPTGRIFGTCDIGGNNNFGTVYSLRKDGTDFKVHDPGDPVQLGYSPLASGNLIYKDGKILLGMRNGGNANLGTILSFDTLTSVFTRVLDFSQSPASGHPVLAGSKLAWLTITGLNVADLSGDSAHEAIYSTNNSHLVYSPSANGLFYLTDGGSFKNRYILRNEPGSTNSMDIHSFGNVPDGYNPSGLVKLPGGNIIGITSNGGAEGGGIMFKLNQYGGDFRKIRDFTGNTGQAPYGKLLYGSDHNIYGICYRAGAGPNEQESNHYVIYKVDTSGTDYSVIKTFIAPGGGKPVSGLTEGSDSYLFGILNFTGGGSAIFKIKKDGSNYSVIKYFNPDGSEGADPAEGLVNHNGYLYGTCAQGGTGGFMGGTLYRIDENGANFSVLHHFGDTSGSIALHGLSMANNNKIYGTTWLGGRNNSGNIFSIDPVTLQFKVVHDINPVAYGSDVPTTKIYPAGDGRLYAGRAAGVLSVAQDGTLPLWFGVNTAFTNSGSVLIELPASNFCAGAAVRFSSPISGTGYRYQWQVNRGTGFVDILNNAVYEGVTTATLSIANLTDTLSNNQYRCAVITDYGVQYSSEFDASFQNSWLGLSTDWNNPVNWRCGIVPDSHTKVVLPSGAINYPVLTGTATCKSLTLRNGATYTIAAGGNLIITGD